MNASIKDKFTSILELLLALVLVTLPLGYALNSISIIVVSVVAFVNFLINRLQFRFHILSVVLIGFYILFLASLLWTSNTSLTSRGLVRSLPYLILPLTFLFLKNQEINKEKVIYFFSKTIVISALYCLLFGVINSIKNQSLDYLFYHSLSRNLSNLSAVYLSVFVSFAISFYLSKKNKSRIDIACLIFLIMFLILLSSKMILFVTILTSLFFFVKRKKKIRFNAKNLLIVLAIISVFGLASRNIIKRIYIEVEKTQINQVLTAEEFGPVYLWTGVSLRVFQIRAFTEILSEEKKGILGFGLNNSQESLNNKYKEYKLYKGFLNYNYHNQYLQTTAELGFTGLIMLLLIFVLIYRQALMNNDNLLLSFIFLITIICTTESFLWRQRGMVFFLLISLLLTQKKYHKS